MPYVASSRTTGSRISSSSGSDGRVTTYDAATKYQFTHSFRTGSQIESWPGVDYVKPDPLSETYDTHLKGDIFSQLAYRKQFIERQITSIQSRSGAPSHFLLGDIGHEFATASVKFTPVGVNTVRHIQSSTGVVTNMTNLVPLNTRTMITDGRLVLSDALIDPFSGYFRPLGAHFSNQGSSFGPTLASVRATAANHISEMNPFAAKASLLSTLLELVRGDIPGLLKSLRSHFSLITRLKASGVKKAGKTLGDEYLNITFGWAPIIRDVEAAIKVLTKLDRLLFPSDSSRRSVDRNVSTRGATFTGSTPLSIGNAFAQQTTGGPYWAINSYSSNRAPTNEVQVAATGEISVLENYTVRTTARFNTTARPSMTNNSHLDRAIDLLGLELTPEVIWELTPWSWLIDWFSNMGTVVGNLTTLGLSNVILNYAYSTHRLVSRVGMVCKPTIVSTGNGARSSTGYFSYLYEIDHKARIAASPFGFDVSLGALSAGQWGILTALGLARSR